MPKPSPVASCNNKGGNFPDMQTDREERNGSCLMILAIRTDFCISLADVWGKTCCGPPPAKQTEIPHNPTTGDILQLSKCGRKQLPLMREQHDFAAILAKNASAVSGGFLLNSCPLPAVTSRSTPYNLHLADVKITFCLPNKRIVRKYHLSYDIIMSSTRVSAYFKIR